MRSKLRNTANQGIWSTIEIAWLPKRPRSELSDLAIGCDRIAAKNNFDLARDRIGPTRPFTNEPFSVFEFSLIVKTTTSSWMLLWWRLKGQRKFLWVRRGCQASQRKGVTSGEVQEPPGKSGELPGKSGKLPGNPWIAVKFHSERKSPKNFRGSSANFRWSPGTSQKLGGAWLPSSDSPNLSPSFRADSSKKTTSSWMLLWWWLKEQSGQIVIRQYMLHK